MKNEFKVTIHGTVDSFTTKAGEAVLDAALRQGILLPHGCRGGFCGSCLGEINSGQVHYPEGLPEALSEEDADAGKALFCKAVAKSDIDITVPEYRKETQRVRSFPARIELLDKLNHDVMLMKLKLPPNERFEFLPGQYIDILLEDGRRRSFSMANAPREDNLLDFHIRLVPGGHFTTRLFQQSKLKDILRIEGPLGSFYFRQESPRPAIMVAGGTGFAPIKAIIESLIEQRSTRPIHLFWGVRSKRDLYLQDLPETWSRECPNLHYIPVLSEPEPTDHWDGETGYVHEAVAKHFPSMAGYDVYLCGPPVMIEAARDQFESKGLPKEQLFFDSFEFSSN